jgi:hypothetical protein
MRSPVVCMKPGMTVRSCAGARPPAGQPLSEAACRGPVNPLPTCWLVLLRAWAPPPPCRSPPPVLSPLSGTPGLQLWLNLQLRLAISSCTHQHPWPRHPHLTTLASTPPPQHPPTHYIAPHPRDPSSH